MKPQVLIRHCDTYDPGIIAKIISEAMDTLDIQPHGRTMIKPNLVIPHPRHFAHTYTRPEFIDGLLQAVRAHGQGITDLSVGENSGLRFPTRGCFADASYPPVLRRNHARPEYFDEQPCELVSLRQPQALRPQIYIPEAIRRCEFFINAPKFKAHAMLGVTFALKNLMGIQQDAHRIIDHDYKLAYKVVDLQEVISPGFIAVDAIIAGEYCELAPKPFSLGLIIMGVNPVAVDSVCTRIVGLDPGQIEYIRLAAERGYGPIDLNDIALGGDVTLQEAMQRAHGFQLTPSRVDEFLNGTGNLTAYLGPAADSISLCPGGCPGALVTATQILENFQPQARQQMRPLSFIIGAYQGEIHPKMGEHVLAVGDCAQWVGQINGREVEIRSEYIPREQRDPRRNRVKNAMLLLPLALANLVRQHSNPVLRIRGCPVTAPELTNFFNLLGKSVLVLPTDFGRFVYYSMLSKVVRTVRSLAAFRRNLPGAKA